MNSGRLVRIRPGLPFSISNLVETFNEVLMLNDRNPRSYVFMKCTLRYIPQRQEVYPKGAQ